MGALSEQKKKVRDLYDQAAEIYDKEFVAKMDYRIPSILVKMYRKYKINGGTVLDTGCGTGHLGASLGNNFICSGIDVSPRMVEAAKDRYEQVWCGDVSQIISVFKANSFDHIVALSWLPLLPTSEFEVLLGKFLQIVRYSVFISCEQSDEATIRRMKREHGIQLFNHNPDFIKPTNVYKGYLWRTRDDVAVNGQCYFYLKKSP